jgi:hypothetical protein
MNDKIIVMKSKYMEPLMDGSTFTIKISDSVVMIQVMHPKLHLPKIFFNAPISEANTKSVNTTRASRKTIDTKSVPVLFC